MRRMVLLLLAALVVPTVPAGAAAEDDAPWTGEPTRVSGTSRYDGGEWIHTDFVYDDYGADTTPAGSSQRVTLASTSGDFRYPDGEKYAGNAADITEVRVRVVDGTDLELRTTLSTLIDPDVPVLGFAFGLPAGVAASAWPFGAGVRSPYFMHATYMRGQVHLSGGRASALGPVPVAVDVDANTITFRVPDLGSKNTVRIVAGAGLAADGDEWMMGSPGAGVPGTFNSGGPAFTRLFDLAFNGRDDEPRSGAWQEDAQSDALLLGDISAFSAPVDLARLREGDTDMRSVEYGFVNRVFHSRQDLGEGIASSFPQYLGKTQPYAVWVPASYEPGTPAPLLVALHSLSVHHNQYRGATSYFTFYEQLGDTLGAIVVTPLARGPNGWYRNEALVDTLEVLKDVEQHYTIDPERTYLTGYSMGGYGTYRIGTLFPDRFASAVSWAGVPTDIDRLENLQHVPVQIVHGTGDELVPVQGVRDQAARLRELGYNYRFQEHPGQDHLSFVWVDDWSHALRSLNRTRTTDPAQVRFRVKPSMWTSGTDEAERTEILGHVAALGFDLTSSYWVRDVVVRAPEETADVDVTSHAIADRIPTVAPYEEVTTDPSPGLVQGLVRTLGPDELANALDVVVSGTASVALDLASAGIDVSREIELNTQADEATTVRLTANFGAGTVVQDADGRDITFTLDAGGLTIEVPAGARTVFVRPA